MFLPKFLGGFKGFRKHCQGGLPILRFIAFLLTSFSKICLGGAVSYPLYPPPPCVHLSLCYGLLIVIGFNLAQRDRIKLRLLCK
jgi:hypothetical protein